MASQKRSLIFLQKHHYDVFGYAGFPGNPTTIHKINLFPGESELLAHSRSLETVDNAYFIQSEDPWHYRVRAYSHTAPLMICGHALLATGHHLLYTTGYNELTLDTERFRHICRSPGNDTWLSLPRYPYHMLDPLPAEMRNLLEVASLPPDKIDKVLVFPFKVFVVVTTSISSLANFRYELFDWRSMNVLKPGALIITCALRDGNYAYRYFSPWWGKPEDSATGSAHCYLAPFWLQAGQQVQAIQSSPDGIASMHVKLENDAVWISGQVAHD